MSTGTVLVKNIAVNNGHISKSAAIVTNNGDTNAGNKTGVPDLTLSFGKNGLAAGRCDVTVGIWQVDVVDWLPLTDMTRNDFRRKAIPTEREC